MITESRCVTNLVNSTDFLINKKALRIEVITGGLIFQHELLSFILFPMTYYRDIIYYSNVEVGLGIHRLSNTGQGITLPVDTVQDSNYISLLHLAQELMMDQFPYIRHRSI